MACGAHYIVYNYIFQSRLNVVHITLFIITIFSLSRWHAMYITLFIITIFSLSRRHAVLITLFNNTIFSLSRWHTVRITLFIRGLFQKKCHMIRKLKSKHIYNNLFISFRQNNNHYSRHKVSVDESKV